MLVVLIIPAVSSRSDAAILLANPADDRAGQDAAPFDGTFNTLFNFPGLQTFHFLQVGPPRDENEFRFALEFDIAAIPTGSTITSATLRFTEIRDENGGTVQLHGYSGDGAVSLADMVVSNVITADISDGSVGVNTIDVTGFIQSLVTGLSQYAGFMAMTVEASSSGPIYNVQSNEAPTPENRPLLAVEYSEPLTTEIPEQSSLLVWSLICLGGCLSLIVDAKIRRAS
ncbi:MAG: DNRLRE domain-containing protein [Pirellulales bacterium]